MGQIGTPGAIRKPVVMDMLPAVIPAAASVASIGVGVRSTGFGASLPRKIMKYRIVPALKLFGLSIVVQSTSVTTSVDPVGTTNSSLAVVPSGRISAKTLFVQ